MFLIAKARPLLIAGLAAGSILAASSASADVKVVARVSVTGSARAEQAGPQTITTFYKGSRIRTETSSTVSIYDTATQQIITANKADKTYRVLSLKDTMTQMPAMLARLQIKSSAKVDLQSDRKTIAGRPAKLYNGTATITIGAEGMPEDAITNAKIDVEQWVTESIKGEVDARRTLGPLTQFVGPLEQFGGMKPVIDAFSKMKGLPLSSRVTVTVIGGSKVRKPNQPIVTVTEVQSVEEGPLSEKLFQAPAGYKKIELRKPQPPTAANAKRGGH